MQLFRCKNLWAQSFSIELFRQVRTFTAEMYQDLINMFWPFYQISLHTGLYGSLFLLTKWKTLRAFDGGALSGFVEGSALSHLHKSSDIWLLFRNNSLRQLHWALHYFLAPAQVQWAVMYRQGLPEKINQMFQWQKDNCDEPMWVHTGAVVYVNEKAQMCL